MKKTLILITVFAVILIAAALLYQTLGKDAAPDQLATQPKETASHTTGTEIVPAPDFTALDINGNPVNLSDFRGKPVILNFWASWCGPCKSEMPDFDAACAEYGDKIHFIMLNVTDGSRETVDTAKTFIQTSGYSFPVYFDTTQEAAYAYGAYSIPLTFFIDAEGYPVAYGQGALSAEALQKGIDMLL